MAVRRSLETLTPVPSRNHFTRSSSSNRTSSLIKDRDGEDRKFWAEIWVTRSQGGQHSATYQFDSGAGF